VDVETKIAEKIEAKRQELLREERAIREWHFRTFRVYRLDPGPIIHIYKHERGEDLVFDEFFGDWVPFKHGVVELRQ
jgi:hypothetical protein